MVRRPNLSLVIITICTVFLVPSNILHFSQAAPTPSSSQSDCPILCRPGQSSVVNYEPGEYVYDYESEITNEVTLNRPESKTVRVKAKVVLTAYSGCDFVLKIQKAVVKTSSSSQEESLGVDGSVARFTLEDGLIGTVCIAKDDPVYVANIKRSIVSLLQNKALNGVADGEVVESDISGRCPTNYTQSGSNYAKTKNLNACLNRAGGVLPLSYGVPYEVVSARNSVPSIKAIQDCEQTLENGVIKSVTCNEVHQGRRLPTSDTKLVTRVQVKLTLANSRKGTNKRALPGNLVKSSIFFDHNDQPDAQRQAGAEKSARATLEKVCDNLRPDGPSSEVPVLLLNLENIFADLSEESAATILNDIKGGQLCSASGSNAKLQKLYIDTAVQSASNAGLSLVAELYKNKELGPVTTRQFYIKTIFARQPNEKVLKSIADIIVTSGSDIKKRLLLAASGLAYRYCTVTNENCVQVSEYQALVDKIATVAKDSCLTRSSEEGKTDNAVSALQALGNLNQLTEPAVNAISACLGSFFDRIKVPALEASRRDPCQPKLKQKAQEIFADTKQSDNVRVTSFISSLRCLQPSDATIVQGVLDSEESVQVGGYIKSQLQNLVKSSSPSTRQLKSAAQQLNHNLKYPKELAKYSRNIQSSLFSATANVGYNAEGNILFSKDSLIPRQLSANLTIDVLGKSYNLLDVGLYLENFDYLQESLFGSEGKLSPNNLSPKSVLNSITKWRRTDRDLAVSPIKPREGENKPAIADLYIRVLGTTVGVISVNQNRGPQALNDVKEKVQNFIVGSLESDSRDVDFIKAIQFLNIDVRIPTVAGFALTLSVEGSTIPSIEYKRQGKRPDSEGSFDLALKLDTSCVTAIKLRQSVVAGQFESGFQFEATLRSGGGIDVSFNRDSKKFEAKLNLPHENLRALEVTANTYWIRKTPSRPESKSDFRPSLHVMPGPEECLESGPGALLGLAGLKVCVIANVKFDPSEPASIFGKQYFSVKLQKTEPSMTGYSLVVDRDVDGSNKKYVLTLDTPGSQTNRKTQLKIENVEDEAAGTRKIEAELDTPIKGGDGKFIYERTNTDSLKSIKAQIIHNSNILSIHGQVKVTNSGSNEVTYEPLLTLDYPSKKEGKTSSLQFLSGKIVRNKGKKVTFDLAHQFPERLATISPMDLFLKGAVEVTRENDDVKYEFKHIELGARDRDQDGTPNPVLVINAHAQSSGSNYEIELDTKYGLSLEHHLTLKETAFWELGRRLKLESKMTSSRVFFLNFDLSTDIRRDAEAGTYNSAHSLTYGPSDRPRWELSSKSDVTVRTLKNFDIQNQLKFYFPVRNSAEETYNVVLKTQVKNVEGQETIVDLRLLNGEEGAKGKVILSFHREAAKNNDFNLKVLAECNENEKFLIDFNHKRTTNPEIPKGWTSSFKHESDLSFIIPKVGSLSQEQLVTVVNILNKDNKKGVSINAEFGKNRNHIYSLAIQLKAVPEKFSAKISAKDAGTEVALVEAHVSRSMSPTIDAKSVLQNVWDITLTRQTPSEGQAITKLDANIVRTGRQILLEVSRKCEGDLHTVKADLKWDAKRDASQSIQLESVTSVTKGSIIIDTKNDLTVIGQKVKLNVNAKIPTQLKQGEHSLSVTFVSVDQSSYQVDYKNNLDIRPEGRTSEAQIDLKLPGFKPTTVTWNVKSVNPNRAQLVFDITADVSLLSEGVKCYQIQAHFKSAQIENGRRSIQVKLDTSCETLGDNAVNSKLIFGKNFLSTSNSLDIGSTKYGLDLEAEKSTEADGTRVKNARYALINIPLPGDLKAQKIEGKISEKCQFTNLQSFEIVKSHEINLDDQPTFNYKYDISLRDGKLIVDAAAESNKNNLLKVKLHGTVNPQLVDLSGNVGVGQTVVAVKATVDSENPLRLFHIKADSTKTGFELKLDNARPDTYVLTNIWKYEGKIAKVEGEVISSSQGKALTLAAKLSTTEASLKVRSANGVVTYILDLTSSHLDAPLKIEGDLVADGGAYGGNVKLEYGWKASGKAVLEIEDGRRKLTINAGRVEDITNVLTLEYTKQSAGTSKTYEGTFSTDLANNLIVDVDKPITGNFKAEILRLEGEEKGFDLKSTLQFSQLPGNVFTAGTSATIKVDVKATNLELHTKASASNQPEGQSQEKGKFRSVEIQVKRNADSRLANTLKIIRRNNLNDEGRSVAYGIVSETSGNRQNFEHKTKLILGDESATNLAIRIHGQGADENCQGGVDLTLPKRTVSLEVSKEGPTLQISAWLDKVKHPEQKLNVNVNYQKLTTDDGAQGYSYKAVVKHPSLTKDLVITRKVVRFGRLTYLDSTTELDIFENPKNKVVIVAKLAYDADAQGQKSNLLKAKFSVKSEGLGLLLQGDGDISKIEGENDARNSYLANLRYSFKNRNGELKSRNVEVVLSEKLQSLLIGDRSNPEFLISRNVRDLGEHRRRRSTSRDSKTLDVRYEIHLPGMKDTRVIDFHCHGAALPHLSVQTFNTDPAAKRVYDLSLGFPNEKELVFRLQRSIEADSSKNVLAELSLVLQASQLLAVKAKWDLKTIQHVLSQASDRFENTGDGVQATGEAYVSELSQDVQQTLTKVSEALPNVRGLQEHVKNELKQIKQEWEENDETKQLSQCVNILVQVVQVAAEPLKNLLSSVCQLPEYLKTINVGFEKLYERAVKRFRVVVGHTMRFSLKTLRPIIQKLKELIEKISARFGTNLNAGAENAIKKAHNIADGFWADAVDSILARAEDLNRYIEQSSASQEIKDLVLSIIQFAVQSLKGDIADVNARVEDIAAKARIAVKKLLADVFTIDLQNGVISAVIPLPTPLNSLVDVKRAIANAWP